LFSPINIRPGPQSRHRRETANLLGFQGIRAIVHASDTLAPSLLFPLARSPTTMSALANPIFWNMKIKIAILTLATFAALC
jgi:hypothetical protein